MDNNIKKQFYYKKLVRDKIVENLKKDNIFVECTTLNDREYLKELNKKILEEAEELAAAKSENEIIEEIVDLQEIITALKNFYKIDDNQIQEKNKEKLEERGAYEKRYYVDYVETPKNYWLAKYCSERPEKYPERTLNQ